MAVAIEGTPQATVDFEAGTGLSYTAETTGSNRIVFLAGAMYAGGSRTISSLTWAGVETTSYTRSLFSGVAYQTFYGYAKETIATGSQDFALTWSGTDTHKGLGVAFTLSGCDQTDPIRSVTGTDDTTSGGTITSNSASVVAGDLAVLIVARGADTTGASVSGYTEHLDAAMTLNRAGVYTKVITADGTEAPVVTIAGSDIGTLLLVIIKAASGATAVINKLSGPFGGPFKKLV